VAGRPVVEHNGWPKGQKIVDDETVSGNCWYMIEEYARHNGHADLLREVIDGVVGT
jgi:hypothetical protein